MDSPTTIEPFFPERLEELMAGYVIGDLEPGEIVEFQLLLATRPDLLAEVNRLQEALALLPYALPELSPSPSLRLAVLQAISTSEKRVPARSPLVKSLVMVCIPFLLTVWFGWENYRLRQELGVLQVQVDRQKDAIALLQQSSTELVALNGKNVTSAASGNVAIAPSESQAVLALHNLPALPPGKLYYLWAVTDSKKVLCGRFNASLQGTVLAKFPIPPRNAIQALAVTLETSPTLTQPVGPIVMTSGT